LLHHAWPILIAQLLSMTMMVADTLIAGHYGTADLAGVAIGSSYYISVVMLLTGTLQAVAPTVAHHVGARRQQAIGPALQQGFWLALLLAVPGVALLLSPGYLLKLAAVPPEAAAKAADYLAATAIGLPAVLFYRTFYAFNNAVGRPRVLMAISAIATSAQLEAIFPKDKDEDA
jgi:MATE family multidrug resistance protein